MAYFPHGGQCNLLPKHASVSGDHLSCVSHADPGRRCNRPEWRGGTPYVQEPNAGLSCCWVKNPKANAFFPGGVDCNHSQCGEDKCAYGQCDLYASYTQVHPWGRIFHTSYGTGHVAAEADPESDDELQKEMDEFKMRYMFETLAGVMLVLAVLGLMWYFLHRRRQ